MMKKSNKRKKWLIPVCIAVVILIMVIGIVRYNMLINENPYNVFVRQYSEVYEPDWELEYVGIRPETDKNYAGVRVHFWRKADCWNLTDMARISYTLEPKIRSYIGEEYQSYAISFIFESYAGRGFQFIFYDKDKKMVSVANLERCGITLPKIIEAFPDMTAIHTDGSVAINFEDLKAISQLEDLQEWWLQGETTVPESWKEYIWSVFPKCEIYDASNFKHTRFPW